MSAHLKAFIVVFVVSIVVLAFFRKPFAKLVGPKRVNNWSITWLTITACVFLIPNYWLFIVVSAGIVFFLSRAEPLKPTIYLLLLCVAPTLGEAIPGFAGIQKFIEVNPQLAVAAVVLIPAMFAAKHMKKLNKFGSNADFFFLCFLILQILLTTRAPSFTHMLRTMIQEFLTIAPLYYVFSRYPKSFADIRVLSAAFIFPVLILSAIAIPEFLRNWHFYYSASANWFGALPFGYTMREGYLRASASVFNPIVWGYVAMCGIGIGMAVLDNTMSRFYRLAGFGLLLAGLITSLSRGPWIGAIAVLGVYILLSQKMILRAFQAGSIAIMAGAISLLTPFGKNVIDLLPFIGDDSEGTIGYRRQLLNQAWEVIKEYPFFGSADFLQNSALQSMRQGQGIIDIVNTYLQVGLKSGLVGLSLFSLTFLSILLALRKSMKYAQSFDPILANYCRTYLATLVGILLTIFTTSSEGQIPYIYWTFAGLGVALSRITQIAGASALNKTGDQSNA